MVNRISGRARVLAWCVLGLLGAVAATALVLPVGGFTDLQVYVAGGRALLHGAALYQGPFALHTQGARLPFTYPPIAAVAFASFAALPWPVVVCGFIVSSAICLGLVLRLTARRRVVVLAVLCCALEPVWQTLLLGQLNLFLLAMVCADCLLSRTRWPRGLLTGVAGALKLTPLVFVLYFAVRRDWRAVFVSLGAFLTVTALGWLCAPRDSHAYWLGALLDPTRIGNVEFASNQSLRGFLFRLGAGTGWWIAGSVVLLGFVVAGARRAEPLAAFGLVTIGGLLVSPVSWSHHWVYVIPFLVYLGMVVHSRRNIFWYCGYGLLLAIFCIGPHWLVPHGGGAEFHWTFGEALFGNAYFLLGTFAVIAFGLHAMTKHKFSRITHEKQSEHDHS